MQRRPARSWQLCKRLTAALHRFDPCNRCSRQTGVCSQPAESGAALSCRPCGHVETLRAVSRGLGRSAAARQSGGWTGALAGSGGGSCSAGGGSGTATAFHPLLITSLCNRHQPVLALYCCRSPGSPAACSTRRRGPRRRLPARWCGCACRACRGSTHPSMQLGWHASCSSPTRSQTASRSRCCARWGASRAGGCGGQAWQQWRRECAALPPSSNLAE